MIAFLPPISAITFLTPSCGRVLRRLADDAQADLHRAGEGDEVDAGVADEEVADLAARAGQEVDDAGRRAGRLEEARPAARRSRGVCSAGFTITVLPATSAALVMPVRMASGKFHGAMTTATPRGS